MSWKPTTNSEYFSEVNSAWQVSGAPHRVQTVAADQMGKVSGLVLERPLSTVCFAETPVDREEKSSKGRSVERRRIRKRTPSEHIGGEYWKGQYKSGLRRNNGSRCRAVRLRHAGFFATVTASLFFPSGNWAVSLLAMFTVLGAGSVTNPLVAVDIDICFI